MVLFYMNSSTICIIILLFSLWFIISTTEQFSYTDEIVEYHINEEEIRKIYDHPLQEVNVKTQDGKTFIIKKEKTQALPVYLENSYIPSPTKYFDYEEAVLLSNT